MPHADGATPGARVSHHRMERSHGHGMDDGCSIPRNEKSTRKMGSRRLEMQTASLFAFGAARQAPVASVAMVSNAIDNAGEQFDTGSPHDGLRILKAIARAARSYLGR